MGFPTRFHGDPKLDDPKLIRGMCSSCKQVREWTVEVQSDGSTIKTCSICGMRVRAKAPKTMPPKPARLSRKDDIGGVIGFIQRTISKFSRDKK